MEKEYTISEDGFCILKGLIKLEYLEHVQTCAAELLNTKKTPKQIIIGMEEMERNDKNLFYKFCTKLGLTIPALKIAMDQNILDIVQTEFKNETIYITDVATFYNKRDVTRLQYDWHRERSYYPNADEVLTLWYPWLHPVNQDNGTMVFAKKSNKGSFQAIKEKKEMGLTQMKIEDKLIECYEKINCNLGLGDAVIFGLDLVHKTGLNVSNNARTTQIARYSNSRGVFNIGWDYSGK